MHKKMEGRWWQGPCDKMVGKADQELFWPLAKLSLKIQILFGSEASWKRWKFGPLFFKTHFPSWLLMGCKSSVAIKMWAECPMCCRESLGRDIQVFNSLQQFGSLTVCPGSLLSLECVLV
jgi:hypothetical protein